MWFPSGDHDGALGEPPGPLMKWGFVPSALTTPIPLSPLNVS